MGGAASALVSLGGAVRLGLRTKRIRRRLSELELDAQIVEVRQRLESVRMQKYRHDVVNAFTAVEGAATLMSRDGLSAADRSTLVEVVDSGLTDLRHLLFTPATSNHVALSELITSVVADAGERDRTFSSTWPPTW